MTKQLLKGLQQSCNRIPTTLRSIRLNSVVVMVIGATMTLFVASVVSACTPAVAAAPVTRIVIFNGSSSSPDGPDGPLTNQWTPYTALQEITTMNDGTLVEDTSLVWSSGTDGGKWAFNRSQAVLHVFYWHQPDGVTVEAYNLSSLLNNNSAWIDLPSLGSGVISPTCLVWNTADGQQYFIKLDTSSWTWSKADQNCASQA